MQPPPLGGAVGRDVCLTVVGNGIVGLGVGLLVIGLLVGRAIGHDVGLMVVGNGVVGLGIGLLVRGSLNVGEFFFNKCCRLMFSICHLPPLGAISTAIFPRQEQPRHRPGPLMAAVAFNVTINDNNDNDNLSFAPCPPLALLSTSFHTASSGIMPVSLRRHCFAVILAALATQASLLCCRCITIVGGASNARVVASP